MLTKEPKGRDVNDSDVFVFNAGFSAQLYRIKINSIQVAPPLLRAATSSPPAPYSCPKGTHISCMLCTGSRTWLGPPALFKFALTSTARR